ncbi:MAG TPA: hypothetical protein VLN59_00885 [Burkholderiales bacterium]|nr:hypothetical protein [Burkholderiales bacterium]
MSTHRLIAAATIVSVLHIPPGYACGYCIEDKMASVYDGALVAQAVRDKHRVAFFALVGPLSPDAAKREAIVHLVESVRGIDRHSTRLSVENAALSFSFDANAVPFALLHRTLARKLSSHGLSLELVSVMERPADFKIMRGSR